jgi:hypothetical protein
MAYFIRYQRLKNAWKHKKSIKIRCVVTGQVRISGRNRAISRNPEVIRISGRNRAMSRNPEVKFIICSA